VRAGLGLGWKAVGCAGRLLHLASAVTVLQQQEGVTAAAVKTYSTMWAAPSHVTALAHTSPPTHFITPITSPHHLARLPRINNAGTNAYKYGPLLESDDEDLEAIVDTNVLGVMLCCKEVCAHVRVRECAYGPTGSRQKIGPASRRPRLLDALLTVALLCHLSHTPIRPSPA
jgi:NAD(P)-dependent dehydrogenase (short-subunit alcohol dehydrogenase family)